MVRYYIRLAWRSITNKPFTAGISVAGLAVGLTAFILLINYTHNETTFDSFHQDKGSIYRVESYFERNGQVTDSWATSSFGYAPAMKQEFPEIKDIVRVNNYDDERVVRYNDHVYREQRVVFADSNFFSFFTFPLVKGDPKNILREPNTVAISQKMAKKYFGNEDPTGKTLHISTLNSKYDCAVSGVFKDFPPTSTLQLDMIISYLTAAPWQRQTWYMHYAYTYVKVVNQAQATAIENRFPAMAEKYKTEASMKEHKWGVHLVPLTSIHLKPVTPYESESKGSATAIKILSVMALVILLVSWINYINIFISRALERAGEIGVRKLTGAANKHILLQFITEALLVNGLALVLFGILMAAGSPLANWLSVPQIFQGIWTSSYAWTIAGVAFLIGTVLTGCIPAFILKNVDTAKVLKNKLSFSSGLGNSLRNGLIIFQYTASVVLVVSALTIYKQMHFMQSYNLGVATDQTLVFQTPPAVQGNPDYQVAELTKRIKQFAGIKTVTQSSQVPGKMVGFGMANRRVGAPDNTNKLCEMLRVDYDFIPAYNLELVKGRNFSRDFGADTTDNVILTENAMKLFGFADANEAVNGYLYLEGHRDKQFKVIGVVKDYHQLSLKENFRPIVMVMLNPWNALRYQYVSLKLDTHDPQPVIDKVQREFKAKFPESSFDFFFLDDRYNKQYHDDLRHGQLVLFFSVLALFIVCLGLVGVSSFMLLKRRKEIGVRKVVGAGVYDILRLLNLKFLRMLGMAFCIAIPLAWVAMYLWLQDYAYRTSIGVLVFVFAVAITALVTIITVTLQAFKTASTKPVSILRYD